MRSLAFSQGCRDTGWPGWMEKVFMEEASLEMTAYDSGSTGTPGVDTERDCVRAVLM